MSRPVDEKIVRMTLDNARFTTKVAETLRSFSEINTATNNASAIDISNMAKGIAAIEDRFSATGVVVASILKNMTDSAIAMGKKMYSAMVTPLLEGGKKRALNIEQAKFQFEGLGMDIDATMKSALDAVKGTAFGLDEAAVVASQFGATGMRAGEDMTKALRGISGVAAMTGSSYSDIGNIFTTVAGNGRLMGNDLLRLGSRGVNAAATLAKAFDMTEEEVRSLVSKGGVSFEDFAMAMDDAFGEHATKANDTYTGSLSNMRAALSRIGASIYTQRYEQLRDIFNATTPVIDQLGDALQPLISAFNQLGGYATNKLIRALESIDFSRFVGLGGTASIVRSFWNVVDSGRTVLNSISDAFRRVFPKSTSDNLVKTMVGFERLTKKLKVSDKAAEKFTTVFQGIFSIFSTVHELAKTLGSAILGIIPSGAGTGVLDFAVIISNMAIAINESVKEGNLLTDSITRLGEILRSVTEWLRAPIQGIIDFSKAIRKHLGTAIDWLKDKLAPVANWFKEAFGDFGGEEIFGGGFLIIAGTFLSRISKFVKSATVSLDGIKGSVAGIFTELGGAIKSFQEQVKYKNLLLITISVGILAMSLKLLESVSGPDIAKSLAALVGSMAILAGGMFVIGKLNISGGVRASITIVALAIAMNIMAGALKKISDIDHKQMQTAISGLVAIVTTLVTAMIVLSKYGGKVTTSSIVMIALATTVTILAIAVKKMADIDPEGLFRAIGALGLIFAELAIFMILVKKTKLGPGTGAALLIMAAAVTVIVVAIKKIADIDTPDLLKGLATIGAILLGFSLFAKMTSGKKLMGTSIAIGLITNALIALLIPIKTFSKMSLGELSKGLGAMAVALLAVTLIGAKATGTIAGAVGIMMMAIALNMLVPPILIFSKMPFWTLISGFTGLGIGMAVLASASMLLAPAVVPMLSFAGAIALIGIAMVLAGGGIALFATGLATLATLTAASVAAIVSALGLLIKGLSTLIIGVVKFVVDLGFALIVGLGKLIPPLITTVVDIIMTLLRTIAENAQDFVVAGYDIVINLMKGIRDKFPELAEVGLETLAAILNGMADALENNGTEIVTAFVRLMSEVIIVVIEAGVQMIDALFGWIPGVEKATAAIGDTAEDYIRKHFGAKEAGEDKGDEFASGLSSTEKKAKKAGKDLSIEANSGATSIDLTASGYALGAELSTGLDSQKYAMDASGKMVAVAGKDGAASVSMEDTGRNFGSSFARGIDKARETVKSKARNIASTASNAVKGWLGIASPSKVGVDLGSNFGGSFATGISDKVKSVGEQAKDMAKTASRSLLNALEDVKPEDDVVRFRVVVDGDDFDPSRFGGTVPIGIVPDSRVTQSLASTTSAGFRQNEDKSNIDEIVKAIRDIPGNDDVEGLLEEVVEAVKNGQVIVMDGERVSRIIEPHIKRIQDRNDFRLNRARGVTS